MEGGGRVEDAGPASGAAGELDGGLVRLRTGRAEVYVFEPVADARLQFARKKAAQHRRFQLNEARDVGLHEIDQRLADRRVVAAGVEHAVARQHVEVAAPIRIPEVWPLPLHVRAVEPDDPHRTRELAVDVLLVEGGGLPGVRGNQCADVDWHVLFVLVQKRGKL